MSVSDELDAVFARHSRRTHGEAREPELQRLLDRALTREGLTRIALDRDESEDDRARAIWTLGILSDQGGLEQLIPLIRDHSEPNALRSEAMRALAHLEGDEVVASLRETLATEPEEELRCAAASSLGFRGPGPFVADLVTILNDPSEPSTVRGYAAEAIGHLYGGMSDVFAPREAVRAVRAAVLGDDDVLRWDAVFALGMVGGKHDLVLLKRILAAELAREAPNAQIVSETEEMIASMRSRRDRR